MYRFPLKLETARKPWCKICIQGEPSIANDIEQHSDRSDRGYRLEPDNDSAKQGLICPFLPVTDQEQQVMGFAQAGRKSCPDLSEGCHKSQSHVARTAWLIDVSVPG